MSLAVRINDFLSGLFLGIGIQLVDFKIEFGRLFEGDMMRIVLADEISPDILPACGTSKTKEKMDKDRFRQDLGGMIEAYREVATRLGIMNESEPPTRQGSGACHPTMTRKSNSFSAPLNRKTESEYQQRRNQ